MNSTSPWDTAADAAREIRDIPVDEPAGSEIPTGKTGASDEIPEELQSEGLTGSRFAELWCIDLWDLTADMGKSMAGLDLDAIRTLPADREQAMRAGTALERLTYKYKWLAWMRSPTMEMSQDMLCLVGFFGGKFRALSAGLTGKPGKPGRDDPVSPAETQGFSE